jgi:hypothetical protein
MSVAGLPGFSMGCDRLRHGCMAKSAALKVNSKKGGQPPSFVMRPVWPLCWLPARNGHCNEQTQYDRFKGDGHVDQRADASNGASSAFSAWNGATYGRDVGGNRLDINAGWKLWNIK